MPDPVLDQRPRVDGPWEWIPYVLAFVSPLCVVAGAIAAIVLWRITDAHGSLPPLIAAVGTGIVGTLALLVAASWVVRRLPGVRVGPDWLWFGILTVVPFGLTLAVALWLV